MTIRPNFPPGGLRLLGARVPASLADGLAAGEADPSSGLVTMEIGIGPDGRIGRPSQGAPAIDLAGRIVLPGFVDSHVHLDKAYTVRRTGFPKGEGSALLEAVTLSMADIPNRTRDDLTRRMERGVESAWRHGTVAMRTHLDTPDEPARSLSWQVFDELRARWAGRVALQGVALMAIDRADDAGFAERCRQIAGLKGIVGIFIPPRAATPARLDALFRHAADAGLDVDFHVDETLDAAADGLEMIADSIARTGFSGRVLAGHCCALASKSEADLDRVLGKVAAAGIHVAALPHSNLFLQDRSAGRAPVRRGMTTVRQMLSRGIPVHFASDNVQDAFFPYGDFDMLEVLRSAVRAGHLDDVGAWIGGCYGSSVAATGFAAHGRIADGAAADLVLFDAQDWLDLLSLPHSDRIVIRSGAVLPGPASALRDLLSMEFA